MKSHLERGKLVTQWFDAVVSVFGGYVVRRCRWIKTDDGWDIEEELLDQPEILFASRDAAVSASGAMLQPV